MLLNTEIDALERRVALLPSAVLVGHWIRGGRGEPAFWSDSVFDLYGLPRSAQPPPPAVVLQQLDRDGQQRMWQSVLRCIELGQTFQARYTITSKGRTPRQIRSTGDRAESPSGERMIIGSVVDVTPIQELCNEVRALAHRNRRSGVPGGGGGGFSSRQWERIRALIADRGGAVSVQEMAAHVRLRAPDFSRRFKTTAGETPHQYVLRTRLERACEALADSRRSLSQVAVDYGFFDQSHFNRHFKRRFGLTPGQFARTVRL